MLQSTYRKCVQVALILGLLAGPLGTAAYAADALIGPDAWRDMTAGKTLYYYRDGALYGREYFYPDSDKVEFCSADGMHAVGEWAFKDDTYCFAYFGALHCFWHVFRDGRIFVIDVTDSEDEQTVDQIIDGGPSPCSEDAQT